MKNVKSRTAGPVRSQTANLGMGDARARSPRLSWGNAALSLALAAVLACAGGVSQAGITILDNTNAGTASLAAKNGLTTRPNRYYAYSFSTTLNYTLDTLTIGAFSADNNPDARTGTISLYNSSGGLPTGTPLAQTSAAITALGTPQYFSFSLPSSFAITAGNTYALSFAVDGSPTDNNFRWSETDTEAIPTGSNGVTFVPSGESTLAALNDNGTWVATPSGNRPTMFVEAAAVPEPATWMLAGIAIAGGLGYRRLRRRKGSGTAVLCSLLAVCMVGMLSLSSQPASAALIIDIQESGSDVVLSFSGSLNLNDLPTGPGGNWNTANNILRGGSNGSSTGPFIGSGVQGAAYDRYNVNNGTSTLWASEGAFFGNTVTTSGGVATGDVFQFYANPFNVTNNFINVPAGYSAGDPLSGSETFASKTFATLGLIEGASSTWTWGAGANADSLTVNVVPEPSAFALCSVVVAGLGFAGVRRLRRSVR